MALMNLFSGQLWRNRHREQNTGQGGRRGGRRRGVWREEHRNLQHHVQNREPVGICCMTLHDRLKGRLCRERGGVLGGRDRGVSMSDSC